MTNKYFTEKNSEATVISKMKSEDKRYSQLMSSLITHLHQFIKEVEPTQEEWEKAIRFLTDVGHITDAQRQEWVLLSDTLGVSMLVDAIVNRKSSGATESTVLGPFYLPGSEVLQMGADISKEADGESAFISGKVTDVIGNPIAGAQIEVWQANQDGFYDTQQPDIQPPMNLRGTFVTSDDGNYSFKTVKPVPYPIPDDGPVGKMLKKMGRHPYRPAHVHFMIQADGYEKLITHIFCKDSDYLDSDTVFGVKEELIVEFKEIDGVKKATYDFKLQECK